MMYAAVAYIIKDIVCGQSSVFISTNQANESVYTGPKIWNLK